MSQPENQGEPSAPDTTPAASEAEPEVELTDAELDGEAQTLAGLLATLKSRPPEAAPKNLLFQVQEDIRQRSRGRYYADHLKSRFPYEALLQALLLVGALVVYALAVPEPPRRIPVTAEQLVAAGSEVSFFARMLNDYGTFTNEHPGVDENGWKHLVGEIDNDRLEALETELSLYPNMRLLDKDPTSAGKTRVRIAIRPTR